MQINGKADLDQVRSMLRMMIYLVQEAREQGLERTEKALHAEIDQLASDYSITEEELFPEYDVINDE